ncbi:aminotransferase class III-fold pyridoxal phosphate-dependent enzyme [Phytoactinopolyspora alkaliphila]|uniref:Aminotransferase class III-fold pyridoxal phosphate-dependent enzyme n=1 Tax=Phytoactinopolyspora alkaliphila TaxID=1783498 RepID=A0A6N9YPA5_9ACTN|nr:aminotransferase class III-fold pyridoxal phosphate-dependent enzyme [Phytoactinopolyspora alkaliphila]NED96777.1 aminotransferase class III-fold pyridoxal phosphate-dependent enzyme [Phytoactinopolyspora alkaliphila]
MEHSDALYARARAVIAGGVSSDARRLPGTPLYVDHASGSRLWDVDGNSYIDYVLGQGPAILGHSPAALADAVAAQMRRGVTYSAQHLTEIEVAERLQSMVPCAELVRFNSVGSEAAHAALRLARGHTGRPKVVKFEGHYHGWFDPVLFSVHPPLDQAGPAERPVLVPGSGGQLPEQAADLVLAPWNDLEAFTAAIAQHRGEIAAVVMEPVLCNSGAITPDDAYLAAVRQICDDEGILLIFDEVITGFRVAPGGAQERLRITPDIGVFGKAMAGGMQVSALAGKAEVMESIVSGKVSHAGTFNSHPVAMAGARAVLEILDEKRDDIYPEMERLGRRLMDGMSGIAARLGVPMLVQGTGHLFQTYLTDAPDVRNYREFAAAGRPAMARLHGLLLDEGINMVPRGLWFLSAAHTDDDVDATLVAFENALSRM